MTKLRARTIGDISVQTALLLRQTKVTVTVRGLNSRGRGGGLLFVPWYGEGLVGPAGVELQHSVRGESW